jgi:methylmalonyl-CoA mutase
MIAEVEKPVGGAGYDAWLNAASKALAGAPFDTLRTTLDEGFQTEPLYAAGQAPDHAVPFPSDPCAIAHIAGGSDAVALKDGIDTALHGGASAVLFQLIDGRLPWLTRAAQIAACFTKVAPAVYVEGGDAAAALALAGLYPQQAGSAGLDPLSAIAETGEAPYLPEQPIAQTVDAALHVREAYPKLVPLMPSDRVWHKAGGSAVEDLGFTLASAVAYWRGLAAAGLAHQDVAACFALRLTATSDIFVSMAKFRAARLLWARVCEAWLGTGKAVPVHILAETSPRELTRYDRHNNMLRGTAAAFAAMTGGADAIAVHPFDDRHGEASQLASRMARNTGAILDLEAGVRRVADPGRGAYAIEALTRHLCERAWALFRNVERQGGMVAALKSGFVAQTLHGRALERQDSINTRRLKITGVSAFPNAAESWPSARPAWRKAETRTLPTLALPPADKGKRFAALIAAAMSGATRAELIAATRTPSEPLKTPLYLAPPQAAVFETMRENADTAAAATGLRPPIHLAMIGARAKAVPRALWVTQVLATGGLSAAGFADTAGTIAEAVQAFQASGTPVVCLCGGDDAYQAMPGLAKALAEQGAQAIYVAGPPKLLPQLAAQDIPVIDAFIYEGGNVAAVLNRIHGVLRVADIASGSDDDDLRDLNGTT